MSPLVTPQTELRLAKRMARLGTETAFETLARARALEAQGKDIVHLEIGEPDFDTPANAVEASIDALHKGWTHYTPSIGLMELREAVAEDVISSRGVKCVPEEVVIVPAGTPTVFFTSMSLLVEGHVVIYTT